MTSSDERHQFSERLQQALRSAEYSPDSPTQLAREFNARFAGQPVTVHAARKWLMGESIPTQEKLRSIAKWLNVTAEWLRFGTASANNSNSSINNSDAKIISSLPQLDEENRQLVFEFIRLLVRMDRKK
jgi:transcriptional regulator with XRE-family HTH domain